MSCEFCVKSNGKEMLRKSTRPDEIILPRQRQPETAPNYNVAFICLLILFFFCKQQVHLEYHLVDR